MYPWHEVMQMLTLIITILNQPACLRTQCIEDGYKVSVVYADGVSGPETVGGCFGAQDQARCYCEKNVGGKGVWYNDGPGREVNIKPSQIKLCIVEQVGPF